MWLFTTSLDEPGRVMNDPPVVKEVSSAPIVRKGDAAQARPRHRFSWLIDPRLTHAKFQQGLVVRV